MTTIEVNCSLECRECGKTLTGTTSTSRYGEITISIDPCEKCLGDANSEGYRQGKESAE